MPQSHLLDGPDTGMTDKVTDSGSTEEGRREKGRRSRKKTALTAFLMEEKKQEESPSQKVPANHQFLDLEAPIGHLLLGPEEAKKAMESATQNAPESSVNALSVIEYLKELQGEEEVKVQTVFQTTFPEGSILGRISSQIYLALLPNTSASAAREEAERFCTGGQEAQKLSSSCNIGIAYGVSPMPPLSLLLEQATEALRHAKVLGENQYAEYGGARKG